MKKSLIILLVLAVLVTFGLASCKNEVQAPADELVSVSFEQAVSRALTATVQDFNKDDYYWYYAAAKTDSTGLISGQTASYGYAGAEAVNPNGKGLGTVTGFSQGGWKFKLFAYAERPTTSDAKAAFIYTGEALGVTLRKGGGEGNQVSVTVSPATTGYGILFVDMAHIELDEEATASHNTVPGSVTVTKGSESYLPESGTNAEYKLPAGQYTVKVEYTDGDIVFATGMVIATVYPGLKTTVTGDVAELITYAEFDAKRNPDIIMTTAGSDDIPAGSTSTDPIALVDEATEKRVSASVPADAAQALIPAGASSMTLALNVDTTDSTSTSVTYDISMYKTIVTAAEAETSKVNSVSKIVTVTIKLSKGLTGVEVTHSGNAMNKLTSKDQDAEGYFYDDSTAEYATLYIKTKSFSPFQVKYDAFEGVALMNGVYYKTLADAIADVPTTGELRTIYLLADVKDAKGMSVPGGKNFIVDFGGHTYTVNKPGAGSTGTETAAFQLLMGSTIVFKNGTINISEDNLTPAVAPAKNIMDIAMVYADLTLEDMTIDGRNQYYNKWVMSFCNGNSKIVGNTSFLGNVTAGETIFDVDAPSTYAGCSLEIDTTGTIPGVVEIIRDNKPLNLVIKNGTFTGSRMDVGTSEQISVSIEGGTFSYDPSAYVAEGYEATEQGDTWVVTKK